MTTSFTQGSSHLRCFLFREAFRGPFNLIWPFKTSSLTQMFVVLVTVNSILNHFVHLVVLITEILSLPFTFSVFLVSVILALKAVPGVRLILSKD